MVTERNTQKLNIVAIKQTSGLEITPLFPERYEFNDELHEEKKNKQTNQKFPLPVVIGKHCLVRIQEIKKYLQSLQMCPGTRRAFL